MEVLGRETLLFEELRDPFCCVSRRAVDHSARGSFARQLRFDHVEDIGKLGPALGRPYLESQVGPDRAAVQEQKVGFKSRLEMLPDIADDFRFGGGGQA